MFNYYIEQKKNKENKNSSGFDIKSKVELERRESK